MKIELQFNSIVVNEQDLNAIVGSFMVPSPKLLPPHRKSAKHRQRKKDTIKVTMLIQDVIEEVLEGSWKKMIAGK